MPEALDVEKTMQHTTVDLRNESGNIVVLTALGMTFICGLLALAIDAGKFLYAKRQLQTLADAAAVAGALEVTQCSGTPNCAAMQSAAKAAIIENGISNVTLATQCASASVTNLTLILNNGPCTLGSNDPNNGNISFVEAFVTMPVNTIFGRVLGKNSVTLSARAEAGGTIDSKYCLYVLSPNAPQALIENGNATLTASCGIIVNSSSGSAAIFNGNDSITTTALDIHGGMINNGNNSLHPYPTTGAPAVPDPFSDLPTPPLGTFGNSTSSPYSGSQSTVTVNGGTSTPAIFNPGRYNGGITINGNASAVFNPGRYIMDGNLILNGGDTVQGTEVMFYFNSGSLIMNGGSHADFTAPTTGTYAGILYFQNRANSSSIILNGDTTSRWQGAVYAPNAQLTLNGGSNVAAYTILATKTVIQNGNVNFTLGSDYSSLPNGSPIRHGKPKANLME